MAKRTKYVVTYGTEIARFSDYGDARFFARYAGNSEVADHTGLIMQFANGELTPEFAHLKEKAAR